MKDNKQKDFIFAVGRRKGSVARVRLYPTTKDNLTVNDEKLKKGDIVVNSRRVSDYFNDKVSEVRYTEPYKITNTQEKYVTTVKVEGGGLVGQLGAVILGISRALSRVDEKNKKILKKKGFLTRDARVRQRRKVGMGGKARRKKQSPKR